MTRINEILLWIVALLTVAFIVMVELFNGPALDDFIMIPWYMENSIGQVISNMYMTWQGRYVGFLINGIIYKSYICFGTTVPISLCILFLNLLLWTRAIQLFFNSSIKYSVLYAIILHGLFFLMMFDTSSYFWLCTKGYILSHSVVLYGAAKLYRQQTGKWYDYVVVVISAIIAGASYEIYAPCLLVFMGCLLLYYWKQENLQMNKVCKKYPLLLTAFVVSALAFFVMVFAPGNMHRMDSYEQPAILSGDFIRSVVWDLYYPIKLFVFRIPYIIILILILGSLLWQKLYKDLWGGGNCLIISNLLIRCVCHALILVAMIILSTCLNTFATGETTYGRARNHLLLFAFVWMIFCIRDFLLWIDISSIVSKLFAVALILLAIEYIYMFPTNCKELLAYDKSRKERLVQLDEQVSLGIKDTIIVVPPLDAAYLHCIVDDISQKIIGNERYTKHALLKSGDVCSSMDDPYAIYNVAYRKVYNLPFDVVTNPDSKLNQYLAE